MGRKSAGLLMYRQTNGAIEVLLIHPGGPYWNHKEYGCWSIPKGECLDDEPPFETAKREFLEETGLVPEGTFHPLHEVKQAGGKRVKAWAFAGDCDPKTLRSNIFTMEWPPKSGHLQTFPEVDRAEWFSIPAAKERIVSAQAAFLDELEQILSSL
jgi:predicted NUDIX family NTP pyrophosphohydrolase